MSKLIIMKGLPASGKSTKAEELVRASGNAVRLNKDLLRTMMHFDKWSGRNEQATQDAEHELAKYFLSHGKNVIVDDTNLNPKTVGYWVQLAKSMNAGIEYVDMTDVSVKDCIERDWKRDKQVGEHVIQKMALQYLNYLQGEKVVICDLDGTLCDVTHRRHFVQGEGSKDWKGFFEAMLGDTPRIEVVDMLMKYEDEGNKIILVSARPEQYRGKTTYWLHNTFQGHQFWDALIMREDHDSRQDTETKSDIYDKYLKNLNITAVIDDRPSVIRMWKSKNLPVIDVGNGEEF